MTIPLPPDNPPLLPVPLFPPLPKFATVAILLIFAPPVAYTTRLPLIFEATPAPPTPGFDVPALPPGVPAPPPPADPLPDVHSEAVVNKLTANFGLTL
jgi:hypothetical protein